MITLNFESLYVFLVSAGIVLIILPFALLLLFAMGSFESGVYVEDLSKLTPYSLQMLNDKQKLILYVKNHFLLFSSISVILGILILLAGMIMWIKKQRLIDSSDSIDRMLNKKRLEQIDIEEVKKIKSDELKEFDSINRRNNDIKNVYRLASKSKKRNEIEHNRINTIIDIENRYYFYLARAYGDRYRIAKDVRIPNTNYIFDIVATSFGYPGDKIYELKMWNEIPSSEIIKNTIKRLTENKNMYQEWKKENCRCILAIFTKRNNIDKMKTALLKYRSILSIGFSINIYDVDNFLYQAVVR